MYSGLKLTMFTNKHGSFKLKGKATVFKRYMDAIVFVHRQIELCLRLSWQDILRILEQNKTFFAYPGVSFCVALALKLGGLTEHFVPQPP